MADDGASMATSRAMDQDAEPSATTSSSAVAESIRDTLIDCMTSFDIKGDAAREAADFILSPSGGLVVAVADCPSVYPPSADAPHDGPGWSGPLRCVLSADHDGDRHWNSGINWREAAEQPSAVPPCYRCGGVQVLNERHDVTDPNTGYLYMCIPCLVWQRNHAQRSLRAVEGLLHAHRMERVEDDGRLHEQARAAWLRTERACVRCLAPGQGGDEYQLSGLCQTCLNGPLPANAKEADRG